MTTLIVSPLPIAAIAASRGSGVANLDTVDPREVWVDSEAGTVSFTVDLGGPREVDTVWLGFVSPPRADATWSITGGINSGAEATLLVNDTLRVPDVAGRFAQSTSALWYGAAVVVRQLVVTVRQPAGMPLTIGRLIVGRAFAPELGKEWGSGRQPIDSGTATTLPIGGYAAVECAKRRYFGWTFGDLGGDDVDELEAIALDHGETLPVLVVDDPRRTRGLRSRILYGRFDRWKQFDRRNAAQTKWELGIEEFLWLPANRATPDGGQMINAAYDWSVASGEPIGLLYRRKRADGTVRPLTGEVFVLTIYDASRAPAASIEATIVQDSEGDYARMVFPAGTSERLVNYRMLAWELSQLLPGGDRTPLYGGSFSVTPTASSTAGTPPTVGDASYEMIIDREEA